MYKTREEGQQREKEENEKKRKEIKKSQTFLLTNQIFLIVAFVIKLLLSHKFTSSVYFTNYISTFIRGFGNK